MNRMGARRYTKASYPVRYGCFSEIKTEKYIFQFNLNGEIKTVQGRIGTWDDPTEWFKRTVSNDWVFYASGGYNGAHAKLGEYYIPLFDYATNAVVGGTAYDAGLLRSALLDLDRIVRDLSGAVDAVSNEDLSAFITSAASNRGDRPEKRAALFHAIIGGAVSVLPPDARHVDYDVIPLTVADGCLYNCRFCRVKSGKGFTPRTRNDIARQLERLKGFYAGDRANYNALFLGQHDALAAGAELISFAAGKAFEVLGFGNSNLLSPSLYLFGSIDSLVSASPDLFQVLNGLPYYTYINIGLESGHEETLKMLGKPVAPEGVAAAFSRMEEINAKYPNIEVTANFVLGESLHPDHYTSLHALAGKGTGPSRGKGAVYLSPMGNVTDKRKLVGRFREIKNGSRLPAFLYLIQRL